MGATVSTQGMGTDSSLRGYAVLSSHFAPTEVREATSVAERWKYKPPRVAPCAGLGFQDAQFVGEPSAFGQWADARWREEQQRRDDGERAHSQQAGAALSHARSSWPRTPEFIVREELGERRPSPADDLRLFEEASVPPLDSVFDPGPRWRRRRVGAWTENESIHLLE